MKNGEDASKPMSRAFQHYSWLAFFYLFLVLVLPASSVTRHTYALTSFEYHVLAFLVAFPTLVIWFAAFYGYSQLRNYASSLRRTPEGIYFDELAGGCTWLAWSLPVSVILPMILDAAADSHPALHGASVIISNYASLFLPLVAFSVIAGASRGLMGTVKVKPTLVSARLIVVAFLMLGVLYCFSTFKHFDLTTLGSTDNPYFLPLWLMVITVTVPYLYAWFMGILAAFELTLFKQHLRGVLYKQPMGLLVWGLLLVIVSSVAQQYTTSVQPHLGYLVLNYRLVLTLLFQAVSGGGFVLLALGAHRLQKIEEV